MISVFVTHDLIEFPINRGRTQRQSYSASLLLFTFGNSRDYRKRASHANRLLALSIYALNELFHRNWLLSNGIWTKFSAEMHKVVAKCAKLSCLDTIIDRFMSDLHLSGNLVVVDVFRTRKLWIFLTNLTDLKNLHEIWKIFTKSLFLRRRSPGLFNQQVLEIQKERV